MRQFIFIFLFLSFISCNNDDSYAVLQADLVGKWRVYVRSDTQNSSPVAGFNFIDNGILTIHPEGNFGSTRKDVWKWHINTNSQIVIVLQDDPNTHIDPIMFPDASPGDTIVIPIKSWEKDTPVMFVKIYNSEYKLIKRF